MTSHDLMTSLIREQQTKLTVLGTCGGAPRFKLSNVSTPLSISFSFRFRSDEKLPRDDLELRSLQWRHVGKYWLHVKTKWHHDSEFPSEFDLLTSHVERVTWHDSCHVLITTHSSLSRPLYTGRRFLNLYYRQEITDRGYVSVNLLS